MGNPRTGYYECPRCKGRQVYKSEETTGAMALTMNTPGPVDPTIVNPIQETVIRCVNCREKANWFDSQETIAYKQKRDYQANTVIAFVSGFAFLGLGIWAISDEYADGSWIFYVPFAISALSFFSGFRRLSK